MAGDLGESRIAAAVVALVEGSPGGEVALRAGLAGGIGGEGNDGHQQTSRRDRGLPSVWGIP
jgi:hypothetical protein